MPTASKVQREEKSRTYPYSASEQVVLSALSKVGKRLTSTELIDKIYTEETMPMFPRQTVATMMRVLTEKVARNGEPFRIERSEARGPVPIQFWKEVRK